MALRVPLEAGFGDAAVDVLVVSGVAEGESTQGLSDLLAAHHHTDGLDLLAPATPSNNTADERAGWSGKDPRGARSFAAEWIPGVLGRSAEALTRALGLPATSLDRTTGADGDDLTAAEAMTTALWPATWGYFLTQLVGMAGSGFGAGLSLDDVDWARGHAQRYLRPGGPLPTIRCGRQPYGVLPVTSLNLLTDSSADGPRLAVLRRALVGLRDGLWRPAQDTVPRVGASDNPSGDLADVLRTDAVPARLRVRRLLGPHYLRHLRLFLGEDLDAAGFWLTLQSLSSSAAGRANLGFLPAAYRMVYEGATSPVVAARVGNDAAAYIRELLEVTDLDALAAPPSEQVPVLKALLRHGLLREHAVLAASLLASDERRWLPWCATPSSSTSFLRRHRHPAGAGSATNSSLGPTAPFAKRSVTWTRCPPRRPGRCESSVTRSGCSRAATEPDLERHLLSTLAATSYRLDAWVTSLATRRLATVRESAPQGILLGGYGWLENLRPEPMHPVTELPDERARPDVPARIGSRASSTHRRWTRPVRRRCCATLISHTAVGTTTPTRSNSPQPGCAARNACSTGCGRGRAWEPCSATTSSEGFTRRIPAVTLTRRSTTCSTSSEAWRRPRTSTPRTPCPDESCSTAWSSFASGGRTRRPSRLRSTAMPPRGRHATTP